MTMLEIDGCTSAASRADGPIYLDHHATTPVDSRVAEVMLRSIKHNFGNPNSADHLYGEWALSAVTDAQEYVAALVGAETADVQFTSGATEAIRFALDHAIDVARHLPLRVAASTVEHAAVIDALRVSERRGLVDVRWIGVDSSARIDMEELVRVVNAGVDLVCVMAANNEVGTVYPVARVAAIARYAGAALLVDASQAAGRVPLDAAGWGVTYLILSAHKVYAPKGVGALITAARNWNNWQGRGHVGTPNVPGIAAFGEACRIYLEEMCSEDVRTAALRDDLEARLTFGISDLVVNGDRSTRLSHNLHVAVPDVPNDAILARVRRHVAISTGAACSSGVDEPSHVLRAMGLPTNLQEGALRIGIGRFTTEDEVARAAAYISQAVKDARTALKGIRTT